MGTPKRPGGPAVLPTAHGAVTNDFVNENSFTNFPVCTIAFDKSSMHYCNRQLFLCTIAIDSCCLLHSNCGIFHIAKTTPRSSVILIITTTIPKEQHCSLYLTCCGLTLWIFEVLLQPKMQNMTTKYSNNQWKQNRYTIDSITLL